MRWWLAAHRNAAPADGNARDLLLSCTDMLAEAVDWGGQG